MRPTINSMASLVITASTKTGREERKKRGGGEGWVEVGVGVFGVGWGGWGWGWIISHPKQNILQSKE